MRSWEEAHDVVAVDEHEALVPAARHGQVRVREAAQLVGEVGVHVQRAPAMTGAIRIRSAQKLKITTRSEYRGGNTSQTHWLVCMLSSSGLQSVNMSLPCKYVPHQQQGTSGRDKEMQAHLKKTGPSVATFGGGGGVAQVLLAAGVAAHAALAATRVAVDAMDSTRGGDGLPTLASAPTGTRTPEPWRVTAAAASFMGASAGALAGGADVAGGKQSTLVSVIGSVNTRQPVRGRPALSAMQT